MKLTILHGFTVAFALATLTAPPASARLGETPEQLSARYGTAKAGKDGSEMIYEKNGIQITATVWKGLCHQIHFATVAPVEDLSKKDFVFPKDPLSEAQVKQLLSSNGGSSTWRESASNQWRTADEKFTASLANGELRIMTLYFATHGTSKQKEEEAGKIEGF